MTKIKSFVEFVYSWLGTFCVDQKTRQLRSLEWFEAEQEDHLRLQLLLGLQSTRASKLWEFHLFRDCLEEKYAPDEICFLLHSRFLLFKGPQLEFPNTTDYLTHSVKIDKIEETIDLVMYKAKTTDRKNLKSRVREYVKIHNPKYMSLDAAFVNYFIILCSCALCFVLSSFSFLMCILSVFLLIFGFF